MLDIYGACKIGDLARVKFICEKLKEESDEVFFYRADPQGHFPLDITVINDHYECFKYLFETYDLNPLHLNELGQCSFSYAIEQSRGNFLKLLVDCFKKYVPGRTIEDFLTIVSINKDNQCALQVAVESSHPGAENTLIILVEFLKMTAPLRRSLFIGAVRICNTVMIDTILSYGKIEEEERRDLINLNFNPTSNYMKRVNKLSEAETTPLIYAINRKDRQLINFLLSDYLIDVNLLNTPLLDQSPLYAAVTQNDVETVLLLTEKDANKSLGVKGVLPLQHAINCRVQYAQQLDSKQAKENFMIIELLATCANDVHLLNDAGFCPFDIAVMYQYTDVIEHFYSVQGDLYERKNKLGKTPIQHADVQYEQLLRQKFPEINLNQKEFISNQMEKALEGIKEIDLGQGLP